MKKKYLNKFLNKNSISKLDYDGLLENYEKQKIKISDLSITKYNSVIKGNSNKLVSILPEISLKVNGYLLLLLLLLLLLNNY